MGWRDLKSWQKEAIVGVGVIGLTEIIFAILFFKIDDLIWALGLSDLVVKLVFYTHLFVFFPGFPFLIYYKYSKSAKKSILVAGFSIIIGLIWLIFFGMVSTLQA